MSCVMKVVCLVLVSFFVTSGFASSYQNMDLKSDKKELIERYNQKIESKYVTKQNAIKLFNKEYEPLIQKAESGNGKEQLNLAMTYLNTEQSKFDLPYEYKKEKYIYWLEKSSEKRIPEAQYLFGIENESGQNMDKNMRKANYLFLESAENGYSQSQFKLGEFFEFGKYVKKNQSKANFWYRKSAGQGYLKGQLKLAKIYCESNNARECFFWTEKAAEQGDHNALFELASFYEKGFVVERDYNKSIELYDSAANLNSGNALFKLGEIYQFGDLNQNVDIYKSSQLYERASLLGHLPSQQSLAMLYYFGRGVPLDYQKAYVWLYTSFLLTKKKVSYLNRLEKILNQRSLQTAKIEAYKNLYYITYNLNST